MDRDTQWEHERSGIWVVVGVADAARHLHHLDRGYENFVEKLRSLGARVGRVSDELSDGDALLAAVG